MQKNQATQMSDLISKNLSSCGEFEPGAFSQLCDEAGPETAIVMLQHFVSNLADGLSRISEALKSKDADCVWQISHRFAGTAELIGFGRFGRFARNLSHRLRSQTDISAFSMEIQELVSRSKMIREAIELALSRNAQK